MDLRAYYKKLREVESQLEGPFVVIVSLETPEGGRGGVMTEVAKLTAAKQILDNRARIANAQEASAFHTRNEEGRLAAEQATAVSKMQFVVVPAKGGFKDRKD